MYTRKDLRGTLYWLILIGVFFMLILLAMVVYSVRVNAQSQPEPDCSMAAVGWLSPRGYSHLSFGCIRQQGEQLTIVQTFMGRQPSSLFVVPMRRVLVIFRLRILSENFQPQEYQEINFQGRIGHWNNSVEKFKAADDSIVAIHHLLVSVMDFLRTDDGHILDYAMLLKLEEAIVRTEQLKTEIQKLESHLKKLQDDFLENQSRAENQVFSQM